MKRALITGITGQDGSYLAEHLLELGYEVHGIVRRVALEDPSHRMNRLSGVLDKLHLHSASLESFPSLYNVLSEVKPDEVYHLAAQSFVSYSFEDSFSTFRVNIDGTHYLLECVREIVPEAKFYFAGSSEMFGHAQDVPQTEKTRFYPRSPYGITKVTGFDMTRNYRESYGMFASSGILFNHESPRRGFEFVTRKITSYVARIKKGEIDKLPLGNLEAKRDWGFAGDYVKAMHLMLQQESPDDFVVATGETWTVRDFCELAFAEVGLNYEDHVIIDPKFYRPAEVHLLLGDATKAKEKLGWEPTVNFKHLVKMMVENDLELIGV
ncbi:GDP-mannose 4,6-dehydratase [Rubinisphaera sp.]|uniref:GDP-mannose 4,6-dehydratase n=1 Tax=Rubinisphaera sp. TaxID=2024857 RepID=UPI000C0E65AA|nr:GDP-mannose 4,6-dehydratase [Rubinisphaera sp.]MBV11443.1 GDP-mannose 4,6-dehydratase [Rubinisphaera sp.]|tara:strand:+ start:2162 stop:3133 length:972 start_codon:yes stop_codon:yes gene_type:complete